MKDCILRMNHEFIIHRIKYSTYFAISGLHTALAGVGEEIEKCGYLVNIQSNQNYILTANYRLSMQIWVKNKILIFVKYFHAVTIVATTFLSKLSEMITIVNRYVLIFSNDVILQQGNG